MTISWVALPAVTGLVLALHHMSIKFTSQYFTPLWSTIFYMQLVVLFMAPFAVRAWMADDRPVFSLNGSLSLGFISLTAAIFMLLYFRSFQMSPSTAMVVAIVSVVSVFASVVLATVLFQETMTPVKVAGIAMAIGGIGLALKG